MSTRVILLIVAGSLLGLFVSVLVGSLDFYSFAVMGIAAILVTEVVAKLLSRCLHPLKDPVTILARTLAYVALAVVVAWAVLPLQPGSGKESAKKTACKSNLKQIGMALQIYSHGEDGLNPLASNWVEALRGDLQPSPYRPDGKFLFCPNVDQSRPEEQIGYAFSLFSSGRPNSQSAEKQLVFESKQLQANAAAYLPDLPYRHPNCAGLVLFEDGHVKAISDKAARK